MYIGHQNFCKANSFFSSLTEVKSKDTVSRRFFLLVNWFSCFLFRQVLISLSLEPRYQNEGFPSSRCPIALRTPSTHPLGPGEEHIMTKMFSVTHKEWDWKVLLWLKYIVYGPSCTGVWAPHKLVELGTCLAAKYCYVVLSSSAKVFWVFLFTNKITFKLKKTWKLKFKGGED